jgi:hypothetical protein
MHGNPEIYLHAKPTGRPKGALNAVTRELKECWHSFFSSPEYQESAKRRILSGSAPHLETYLFNRIYGKPTEHIAMTVNSAVDLSAMTDAELADRAEALAVMLRELGRLDSDESARLLAFKQPPKLLAEPEPED